MRKKKGNKIFFFPGKGLDSNVYLLKKQRALIDTGSETRKLKFKRFLKEHGLTPLDIDYVFLTHFHPDHTGKLDLLKEAKVFGGMEEGRIKEAPRRKRIKGVEFEVIRTPGHTEESISVFVPDWNVIFTGDTKFSRLKWGRADLPSSNPEKLEESIKKINWRPWYLLLPGHGTPYKRDKFLGIDLGVKEKTGLCFLSEELEFKSAEMSVSYIKEVVNRYKPNIIAIDAPLSKTNKPYRKAELEMKKEGYDVLPLNTEGMRRLMKKGVKIKEELREEKYFVIETHPGSTEKALEKSANEILEEIGFKERPSNKHEKDAFLACLAAYYFPRGRIKIFGEENRIVIAKP